jgi:hypothetical protein
MTEAKEIDVYFNSKQLDFLAAKQRIKFALCGRGFGKSHLIGAHNIDKMKALPGAKSALVGMTYRHLKNKTLIPMEMCWREHEMSEYDFETGEGDYVLFRKPPKSWIKEMIAPPKDWDYVISFPNGYHIELVSLVDIDKVRGASFDAMDIDEAALCDKDDFTEVLSQTVRGNIYVYKHHLHQSISLYTSIPWLPSGQWIYIFEKLAEEKPETYYFMEASAEDNVVVLGEQWIEDQRERLPPIKFSVEIMNERISKLPDCFYYAFDEKRNTVSQKDIYNYYYQYGLDSSQIQNIERLQDSGDWLGVYECVSILGCTDYVINPYNAIDITFDFNAAFNSLIWGQESDSLFVFHEELFVKHESYLELVEQFCKKFKDYPTKIVNLMGDRNGNKKDADNAPSYFESIIMKFNEKGWQVNHISTGGVEQLHTLRYDVINRIYSEKEYPVVPKVRYIQEGCKFTIISILKTPAKDGFKKDKSSERKLTDRREEATDLGDASDYLLYDKYATRLAGVSEPSPIIFPK